MLERERHFSFNYSTFAFIFLSSLLSLVLLKVVFPGIIKFIVTVRSVDVLNNTVYCENYLPLSKESVELIKVVNS